MCKIVSCLVLIIAFAGCGAHAKDVPVFAVRVSPAIAGEANAIELDDRDASQPSVSATMRMTDMEMPVQTVTLTRTSPGIYRASNVIFSMSGHWSIRAAVPNARAVDVAVR